MIWKRFSNHILGAFKRGVWAFWFLDGHSPTSPYFIDDLSPLASGPLGMMSTWRSHDLVFSGCITWKIAHSAPHCTIWHLTFRIYYISTAVYIIRLRRYLLVAYASDHLDMSNWPNDFNGSGTKASPHEATAMIQQFPLTTE